MEFITIVYRKELAQLRLQARSFRVFCNPNEISRITIIVNDDEHEDRCFDYIYKEVLPDFGDIQGKIRVVSASVIMPPMAGVRGYVTQQIVKLEFSRLALEENYIVLDAKNFFIRKPTSSDFFDTAGRAKRSFESYTGYQAEIVSEYNTFLEVAEQDRTLFLPAMMTPFPINRKLAFRTISAVEEKGRDIFRNVFAHQLYRHSEFLLYAISALAVEHKLDLHFANGAPVNTTIWSCNENGIAGVEWHIETAIGRNDALLGLHSRCISVMHQIEWLRFEAFLQSIGLIDSQESRFWRTEL